MVGEAYDHLMAVVVLGVIFTASVVVVPNLSYVNLLYIDQQQMQNIALSAMKTILYDQGYPTNWGTMHGLNMFNENDVKRFGLAALSTSSLYVLDQYKVQRLAYNPMGNMSYSRMKALLGITGYDFTLILRPQVNVTADVTISPDMKKVSFNVGVSRYGGQPVPNAIVAPTVVYCTKKGSGGQESVGTSTVEVGRFYTDSFGRCTTTQDLSVLTGYEITDVAVIFRVTVAGRMTMVISRQSRPQPSDAAKISMVGDELIATIDPSLPGSRDSRTITDILMYNFETYADLYDLNPPPPPWGTPDLRIGDNMWNMTFSGLGQTEATILIFTIRTDVQGPGGKRLQLLIGPFSMWSQGGVIECNARPPSSGALVIIDRDVIIAGMAYTAELRLWKT